MNRRGVVYGGIAAAACCAAGFGLALWRERSQVSAEVESPIWSARLETLDGKPFALHALKGQPLLLNFWATWCPPCVEELPLLERFYQQNSANGWHVLGFAVDQVDAVQAFLRQTRLTFPIVVAGSGGLDLSVGLGNIHGGLPFSVVLGRRCEVLAYQAGALSAATLARWVSLV